jgi:hypothetical protein
MRPGASINPSTEKPVIDLPEPDSPQAHAKADAQPVHHRGEHVAPERIATEQIEVSGRSARAGRQAAIDDIERGQIIRILRRDPWCKQRNRNERQTNASCGGDGGFAEQAAQHDAQSRIAIDEAPRWDGCSGSHAASNRTRGSNSE